MLRNIIILTIRGIKKNPAYNLIKIIGLSAGMASAMFIFLFIQHELGYDKKDELSRSVYRIHYNATNGMELASVPPPIKPRLKDYFPEIESAARLYRRNLSVKTTYDTEVSFEEENVFFVDSTLLDVFALEINQGDSATFLSRPNTVWINTDMAFKYFGKSNVTGEKLLVQDKHEYIIQGVFKDLPIQSHIHFNLLFPYEDMFQLENETASVRAKDNLSRNWVISHSYTYVKLHEGSDPAKVNDRFPEFVKKFAPENLQVGQAFFLFPVIDIHLKSQALQEPEQVGSMRYVYVFSGIALLTLLIACFNFINLSTAYSIKRAKEIGLRKVFGADSKGLFIQFLGEAMILAFLAFIISMLLIVLLLPSFSAVSNRTIELADVYRSGNIFGFIAVFLLTGILAGSYPAFYITKIDILTSIQGKLSKRIKGLPLWKVLLIVQFAISIFLISGSIIIYSQINYIVNKPLGFQTEEIINVPIFSRNMNSIFGGVDGTMRARLNSLDDKLSQIAAVKNLTFSSMIPGLGSISRMVIPEGKTEDEIDFYPVIAGDYDFADTYGLEIIEGRNFDVSSGTDHLKSFIINEKAISEFGWKSEASVLGKEINLEGKIGNVIGVVKNFHHQSFREPISPLILEINVSQFNTIGIRIDTHNFSDVISRIEEIWLADFPEKTFEYYFLEDQLKEQYESDYETGNIIAIFSALAILLSALGAYGLILFNAKKKEKEIGVRKVLGAGVLSILKLMLWQFTVLFVIGFILATPLSYYAGIFWLEEFDQRIVLSPVLFISGGLVALFILWFSIGYQSLKASLINPATILRDE